MACEVAGLELESMYVTSGISHSSSFFMGLVMRSSASEPTRSAGGRTIGHPFQAGREVALELVKLGADPND
jgi:hypothetical protein